MNRRTLWQAIGGVGLATVAGRQATRAAQQFGRVRGETVVLGLHESVTTESGVTLRFSNVKDHRCAQDVTCVWAGFAEVWIDVRGLGVSTTEYFTVGLDDTGVRRYDSFVLILNELIPTPRPSINTPLDEYQVELVVVPLPFRRR
ncbi:MAG: hypothetical protein ACRDJW_07940 [Thermomicrobiales bacterium]